jgi:predicted nucleotidyltransferase
MNLTAQEIAWISRYRSELDAAFPGLVQQIIVFGSKARGTAGPDSDLDLLVLIRAGDWRVRAAVAEVGYVLSDEPDVDPSITVRAIEEWHTRGGSRSPFWQTVTRDGIAVG